MNRNDFIKAIFEFFRTDNKELQRTYDLALSVKYLVDWDSLYHHIIKTTEKRLLPMPKVLIDMLPSFRIYETVTGKSDGSLLVVNLLNGTQYQFTVMQDSKTSLNDIKERFKDQLKSIKKYPIGTVVMKNKIFLPEEEQC